MRKDDILKVMLTIAVLSLIVNVIQYGSARATEHAVAREYVSDRVKAMETRANAFYMLVLENQNPLALRYSLNDREDELIVEFGVRVPCEQQERFLRWMKDWDAGFRDGRSARVTGYTGGESGYRTFKENGKEIGEIYEKMSFSWR
jgi:hypothetical protein